MTLRITHGPGNAPLTPLQGRIVAVLGYGNQGRAHALNLRDSGITVIIGNRRETANARAAAADGFEVVSIEDAAARADLVIIALPDEVQPAVYEASIAPHIREGATIGFLHGFAIRYGSIEPSSDLGVILIAPKGPGATLRQRFTAGLGLPALLAVHQDNPARDAEPIALAWANGIGSARAGIMHTTFADEAETDLFGEQAVLCGGMTWLILAAFETLVEAGYPPELAYLECCHEVKQVADLMHEGGMAPMLRAISNTAEFGAYDAGPRIVDAHVRGTMRDLLQRVRSGEFAEALKKDHVEDGKAMEACRKQIAAHEIEDAGRRVRALMPWLAGRDEK